MTYNTHYPAFNEKEVPMDRYMKDLPELLEDYKTIKANKIGKKKIKILSDLELITQEEAEKYLDAQENLELGLTNRVAPSELRDQAAYDAGGACAMLQALLGSGMGIACFGMIFQAEKNPSYWPLAAACGLTMGILAAVGSYYFFTGDSRQKEKKAKSIDLEKAYVDYLMAARPLTEIKTGERIYNPNKEKTHEVREIINAVETTNKNIDIMYKRFSGAA